MGRQSVRGRLHSAGAISVLALGLGGVALAQHSGSAVQVDVTLLDGKLKVSPTTFPAGSLSLVVVNEGKLTHALAIMGTGLQPRRTPTLPSGKSARLNVVVKVGMYHVWDPVRSSMSHATMLMVRKTAAGGSSSSSGTTSSGATSGSTTSGGATSAGTSGGAPAAGPGTNPPDPCADMGMGPGM